MDYLEKEDVGPGYNDYLRMVRPEINASIRSHVAPLFAGRSIEPGFEGILVGGKRLRGGLTMAAFELMSSSGSNKTMALDLASAVELSHTVSLIYDDIVDEDKERRGTPTLHTAIGRKSAMLEGLGLLSTPYTIASMYDTVFVGDLSEVHLQMVRGAIIELQGMGTGDCLSDYEGIVELKTGSLFGLAAKFGSMAAIGEPEVNERMRSFGVHIGTIYQILDDLSDLRAAKDGTKALGHGSEAALIRCVCKERGSSTISEEGEVSNKTPQPTNADEWNDVIAKVDELLAKVVRRAHDIANGLSSEYPRHFSQKSRIGRKAPSLQSIILGILEIARNG